MNTYLFRTTIVYSDYEPDTEKFTVTNTDLDEAYAEAWEEAERIAEEYEGEVDDIEFLEVIHGVEHCPMYYFGIW